MLSLGSVVPLLVLLKFQLGVDVPEVDPLEADGGLDGGGVEAGEGVAGGTGMLPPVEKAGVGVLGAAGGLLAADVLNAGTGSLFTPYVSCSGAGLPPPGESPKAGTGAALLAPAGNAGTVKLALHSGHFIIWPAY